MYIENEMQGATNLRSIISYFLRTRMPAAIDRIREQAGYDETTLPYPVKYDSLDPYKSKTWPTIGSYINSTEGWTQVDTLESGSLVFEGLYDVSVFVGAGTAVLGSENGMPLREDDAYGSAIRIRDELITIVRALILNYPSLGTAGQDYRSVCDPNTIRESYPEPTQVVKTDRFLAAGILSLTINYREPVTVPIYGPLNGFDYITDKIDDTP